MPNNPTISLKPASNRTSTGLRHGHPAHRSLSAIPTWRTIPQPISKRFLSGVITGLRHGDLAQKDPESSPRHPCAISAPSQCHPRIIPAPSQCYPRTIPALSPHHLRLANRSSTECWPIRGLFHGHRGAHWVLQSVFGTATLPTGASEPSPRGEAVIYRPFGTATLPTGASEPSPRGKAFF